MREHRQPARRRAARLALSLSLLPALASAYDLDGAFSAVNLKRLRDASEREVIQRVDALLER